MALSFPPLQERRARGPRRAPRHSSLPVLWPARRLKRGRRAAKCPSIYRTVERSQLVGTGLGRLPRGSRTVCPQKPILRLSIRHALNPGYEVLSILRIPLRGEATLRQDHTLDVEVPSGLYRRTVVPDACAVAEIEEHIVLVQRRRGGF